MLEAAIAENLQTVRKLISDAVSQRSQELTGQPRLVAVSKTKPKELIIAAYIAGQRVFGENYIQELLEKANDPEILEKCPEISWHFIGHLQSKKIRKLINVPNLSMVETVDTLAHALLLNQGWEKTHPIGENLRIFLQVNTSGEQEKSGCSPSEVATLAVKISDVCPRLSLAGVMTIGKYDNYDEQIGINPDFKCLMDCRNKMADVLQKKPEDLEVSMGMSGDFEHAITVGSTNIRVGQKIFGARDYTKMAHFQNL